MRPFTENYKILVREINEDLNKLRVIIYSGVRRLNTVKILILPEFIHILKEISIKILAHFLTN